ncbi:MAG: HEPN domain-containing protein [bacterium]
MKKEYMDLANYRIERAEETFEDALTLFKNERFNSAMNRMYYSIFYAIKSLLATKGLDSSKHSGVISLFHKEFVKSGIVSKKLGQIVNIAFRKRTDGDYKDFYQFSKEEVEDALKNCKIFLKEIKEIFGGLKNVKNNL